MQSPPLDIALVAASPLVLAGLRAGLGELGGFEVVLESRTLEAARSLGFGGARVVIADALPQREREAPGPVARNAPRAPGNASPGGRDALSDADGTASLGRDAQQPAHSRGAAGPDAPDLADADADADAGPPLVVLADAALRGADIAAALADGITVLSERVSIEAIGAAAVAAAAGLVSASPALWERAAREAGSLAPGESAFEAADSSAPPEPLTPREQQVLSHMSEGLANREIAQALQISPHTAKYHVGQIIAKLQASSRAHAVAKALRAGWVVT